MPFLPRPWLVPVLPSASPADCSPLPLSRYSPRRSSALLSTLPIFSVPPPCQSPVGFLLRLPPPPGGSLSCFFYSALPSHLRTPSIAGSLWDFPNGICPSDVYAISQPPSR
ncbi:hypothetical protein GY45DRAFT_1315868 [Cubamyces sp. BRFM 1775]|nr:hypothetical protein GY45DRAFT_1315868 [Cubamyces sp. BRFM 1775]